MTQARILSRRALLRRLTLGAVLGPVAAAATLNKSHAADSASLPLLAASSPEAKALQYVEDARQAPQAKGNNCATCALYEGSASSTQGPCQLFKDKAVRATGWCTSWAPQM